jgi:kinesin family protein 5
LTEIFAGSAKEVLNIVQRGLSTRVVSSTSMNDESSRSHAIFSLTVSQKNLENGIIKTGKLALVDLAGSEKVAKTGATGQTLEEAKKINKSLSALGNVINALTDGKVSSIFSSVLNCKSNY